jgi:hypothetical protein
MTTCVICGGEIEQTDDAYRRVTGWEKRDGVLAEVLLMQETGQHAHEACVETSELPRERG